MGDRLPEDAFAYHYEDPICTMESRYWNFILENFILSANEIYTHCLTTQNLAHTREMISVTQNQAYDFCNLIEYLKLRRAGINAPIPSRNTFNIIPAGDFHEEEQLEHTPPKCKTKHSHDDSARRKKKGTNVKAPPFIPSIRSDIQQQQQSIIGINDECTQRMQQLPADSRQQTMPEQTWAQIVPQLQQITLPHYHIPFTNLVHYPIGNIYTHQISQNYPTYSDVDVHHSNKLPGNCGNPTGSIQNPSEEHEIANESLVAHTGVQVELSGENSQSAPEDVELTQEEINVNKLLSSPQTSDSRDSEEKIVPPAETLENVEVFSENSGNVIDTSSTNLNLETLKSRSQSRCSTPIKELYCDQLQEEFVEYEKSDEDETKLEIKSTYKDVLMKGICPLQEISKETIKQETAESFKADEWKQVIRRKSSNMDVKSYGSANRYNATYVAGKINNAKKSQFSKIVNRRRQNLQEVYAKTSNTYNKTASRGLTQNRTQSTSKLQDMDVEEESKADDEEEVEEKYDDVKIVKEATITFNKLTKTSDNIDANSTNILKNNKSSQETNLIEEFEKNLTIEFNEPLQISIKPKEWQIRKISTKKRRNNDDLTISDPQITDESNDSHMDSSAEETNIIESNLNAEMWNSSSQECSKTVDIVETAETSDNPLSLLTSESPPSYELSCSPDRLIDSETSLHDNTMTKFVDTNPAESGLYVSCDQNVDDDEYENAMLQLLSPTNASFYDFLSSITPENTDSKENYRQLFNDFKEYFNSLPVTAQKEEMDILRKIFFENVEVACNFRISTIEEFELLFAENPIAASQLENHINSKLRQIRESETKQQLAYEKRLQLLQCKTARVREQVQKVEEAKAAKYKLALQRKSQIDLKLKKAEENRKMYLSIIRKKAHDEEEKLKEIAFINELEAQNRRHDSLALRQEHEGRLQILIEERQRRLEEKAAKEAAVEERRRVLEAERQEKLEKMKEKRRRKEEIIDRKQQEREKERLVIAREKAREREERLQARKEAHLATVEELQKRIQQKQEESARRHEENIELIRQKALEVGLHRSILDDANHEDAEAISNLPKDKSKTNVKRRYKKIRTRLMQRGDEFLRKCNFIQQDLLSLNCGPLVEMINELSSFAVDDLLLVEKNVHTVERMLTEVSLIMERKVDALVLYIFIFSKGIVILGKFVEAFIHLPVKKLSVYKWILEKIIKIYHILVHEDVDGFKYVVGSNGLMLLFELLNYSVGMLTMNLKFFPELTEKILNTSKIALKNMSLTSDSETSLPYYKSLIADLISYILTCGLTTKIPELFQVAVISEGGQLNDLIPKFVDFLAALVHKSFLSAELMRTLKATDCLGTVPLLYEGIQKMTPANSLPIYARSVIQLLLSFAKLDIAAFQETLGAEGMALQMRAIASFLMSYCAMNPEYDNMLQDVIEMVGYFAVYNLENQSLIQSGQQPTILQQLVSLPFNYFCDARYKWKLFPTLIVCSHNNATNRAIVENECSYKELESFIETPNIEEEIPLLKIFLEKRKQENGDAPKENPSAQQ